MWGIGKKWKWKRKLTLTKVKKRKKQHPIIVFIKWERYLKSPFVSATVAISRFMQMSSYQMSKLWNSWCPDHCLTPYPHYLTSISLLVTPQQIRKASQHLHGDRPQSSRWPQCAAWQLKRKRRAGKWKWVRIGGGGWTGNVNMLL